jgi:hypothetical protein
VSLVSRLVVDRGAGLIGGADNVAACALYDTDVARDGTHVDV